MYDPGANLVNAQNPQAALNNIPDALKDNEVLDDLYVSLIAKRSGCATASFNIQQNSKECKSYFAAITSSCDVGGLNTVGCFDWGVKAFTVGSGGGTWSTA